MNYLDVLPNDAMKIKKKSPRYTHNKTENGKKTEQNNEQRPEKNSRPYKRFI